MRRRLCGLHSWRNSASDDDDDDFEGTVRPREIEQQEKLPTVRQAPFRIDRPGSRCLPQRPPLEGPMHGAGTMHGLALIVTASQPGMEQEVATQLMRKYIALQNTDQACCSRASQPHSLPAAGAGHQVCGGVSARRGDNENVVHLCRGVQGVARQGGWGARAVGLHRPLHRPSTGSRRCATASGSRSWCPSRTCPQSCVCLANALRCWMQHLAASHPHSGCRPKGAWVRLVKTVYKGDIARVRPAVQCAPSLSAAGGSHAGGTRCRRDQAGAAH